MDKCNHVNRRTRRGLKCPSCLYQYKLSVNPEFKRTEQEKARVRIAAWLEANREHHTNYCRAYYKVNKERINARNKAYFLAHIEQARASHQAYYRAHKTQILNQQHDYNQAHPELIHKRTLKISFNLTPDDYDNLLKRQNGRCAICGATRPGHKRRYFSIDHDHETGKIRGLLCGYCNPGLGHFKDDVTLLRKAVTYLENHDPVELS